MKILVTGGAGFLGSHLCDRLIADGHLVLCLDNFYTGNIENIKHHLHTASFKLLEYDIAEPIHVEVDQIYNLASPAAPGSYMRDPEATLRTNIIGVTNILGLARKLDVPIFQASTIRVYDTVTNNPYIDGKRKAEELCLYYSKAKIGRLHTTIGTRMAKDDSRVFPHFIAQARLNQPLEVWENKVEKICFVDEMIGDIIKFMESNDRGPIDIGHPIELSLANLARLIVATLDSKSEIKVRI